MYKIKQLASIVVAAMLPMMSLAADQALIVGVGQYQDPNANLPGIELDVAMMEQMAAHLGIRKSNTVILRDQQATKAGFKQALETLAGQVSADDRVVIYFSGHGSNLKDTNGDEEDGLDETLYMHDGHFVDDEFAALLKKIPSQNIVVLMDSCHSGTGAKSLSPNLFSSNSVRSRVKAWKLSAPVARVSGKNIEPEAVVSALEQTSDNYLSIGAAQDNQQAQATAEGSLFTKSLLSSFEDARAGNQQTTWKGLFESAKAKLAAVDQSFTPNLSGNTELADKVIRIAPAEQAKPIWDETFQLARQGSQTLSINTKEDLVEGDLISMEIEIPEAGYLNVINVGPTDEATLLFPNKFDQNNKVEVQTFKLPTAGKFVLRAKAPLGKNLIAAFLTQAPIDLQQSALGNKDVNGQLTKTFGQLSLASTRAIGRHKSGTSAYAAGYRIVTIQGK